MLRERGIPFEALVLGRDVSPSVLRALAGSGLVPQVFVNGRHVGGADRLEAELAAS